ncbi:MAG: outer membrane protein assembly factor BamE [Beijerinckiaceae bacterium]|jgi:outer membrane protein assembly factor BamE (lipoprotein component of BamABCDE complex)|nr:outer membrane protein assembly factor BamE [Beijerinckiaceae bacterium]
MDGILHRNGDKVEQSHGLGHRATRLAAAAALALSLGGCLGYDGSVQHGYVLDQRQLEQVKTGSSAQQVLTILGTPSTTSTVGGDAWYYITQKTERKVQFMEPKVVDQRVLAVYFDKAKRVTRVANYGLEDGQPIDLISRTTPTGGSEQSFVMNALKGLLRF